jgi:hypothetical protein
MRCVFLLTGKTKVEFEADVPMRVFEDDDTSEIYNIVCKAFPNNDWEDMCCDNIKYFDDFIECHVSVF